MKFFTRIRFMVGILFVLALVGALVLYINYSMSFVHASQATLESDGQTIGTDFAGLVSKQAVNEGDTVKKGQILFAITSPQLTADIANGTVQRSSLPFKIDPVTKDILITAPGDGVVQKVNYLVGSFAPNGAVLATVNTIGTSYVSGHFHLSPRDYTRVRKGNVMDITLPDNRKVTATVFSIALVKDGNQVDTVVKARLGSQATSDFTFPVGTPVEASLKLSQRTWYQNVLVIIRNLLKPTGH